ncbi:MAG TPA: tetratricopeptide repeat protein, partial [Candidatus Paceibacterota bacterium]
VFALGFHNSALVQKSSFLSRLTDISSDSFTVKTRLWAWEAGFKGWKENFKTILLGWGPESFNYPFAKYFNPQFFRGLGSETLFDRAHNMFIEVLVTMGLIGFLAYISIFWASLRSLWKMMKEKGKDHAYAVGLFCLVVVYAIHNSFIFDTAPNFVTFFSILGFISFLAFPQPEPVLARPKTLPAVKKMLVAGLAIVMLVVIYDTNLNAAKANYTTTRAIVASWNGDFNGAVTKYREAVSYEVAGKYEYRHRFAQYILEYSLNKKMTPDLAGVVQNAVAEVQKNVDENPKDYLPYLYMSRLYITLGRDDPQSPANDKALEFSLKALDISPTFVRTYYEVGQAYLNKKDFNNAVKYFEKAAELNPNVGLSIWYYAIVEFERGNYDQGNKLIDEAISKDYSPTEADYNRLVTVYAKKNDYPRLIKVYEALIKINPNDPQYYASLAVSYARVGRIEDAINAARKAAQVDPSFEAEARSFVSSLGHKW